MAPGPLGDHSAGYGANDEGLLMRHNEPVAACMVMAGEAELIAQTGPRQQYPALRDPPRGVNRTSTAAHVAAVKENKVGRFVELVQVERGYMPLDSEQFVTLPFEPYGEASEPTACERRWRCFATSGRHRLSTAVQQRNAELMGYGKGSWSRGS